MAINSIRNTVKFNLIVFILVLLLEILIAWSSSKFYDTSLGFFIWQFFYATMVMLVISINHYVLIPFIFDKKRYVLYAVLLFVTICIGIQLKTFGRDFASSIKIFLIYTYITGTGMAFFFLNRSIRFQKKSAEKDKLQKETELNYLREQVNPHFLFNSLNSIYSLSQSQSPETPDLIMQLSELMRYQLESSDKKKVTLKEEFEFIKNYLLLEEKRLSERCTIEFDIENEISDITIAPMLLIPFVENAIKHGAQSTNKKSAITITASFKDDIFNFAVINSKPQELTKRKRKGMGLKKCKKEVAIIVPQSHLSNYG